MARAAANRNPKPKAPAARPPKPSRAVRKANRPVEETLFFQRMRKSTKWVFALLVVVFAFSFVVAGVGSGSTGVGSVFDAFGSLFGRSSSSSGPSLSHALKALKKNPKDAAADLEAAKYYLSKSEDINAISYYESYVKLRPKDAGALRILASLYQSQADAYNQAAQSVQPAQATASPSLGQPSSSSTLGKALSDPLQQFVNPTSTQETAQQLQYQQYVQLQQQAELQAASAYKRLVAADPTDPTALVAYGRASVATGDKQTASKAFRTFLQKFPDDSSAPAVRALLKRLTGKGSG